MKSFKIFGLLILTLTFTFSSCSEEEINPGTAPEMPPSSSMEMDYSNFNEGDQGGRIKTSYNWTAAAVTVGIWNSTLAAGLAVPVSSFKAAVAQTPTYDQGRKAWVWSFSHSILGRTFSFDLTGKVVDGGVEWKMYASEEGGFQDALWYYGRVEADGSGGYWILNKDGNDPTEFLRIDWEKGDNDVAYIKYTNIEEGNQNKNAYIEFGKLNNTEFNRYYTIVGAGGGVNNSIIIEWHNENGNGRIKVGQNSYQCWDTEFQDTEC